MGAVASPGNRATERAIDAAAAVGASPYADDKPTAQIVETPEGQPVDPQAGDPY